MNECVHPWEKVRLTRVMNGTVMMSVDAHCKGCGTRLDMREPGDRLTTLHLRDFRLAPPTLTPSQTEEAGT